MRLTKEQSKQVEENHNLIYWYANLRDLNLNDWYDLLAIELCFTVHKYQKEKGSLSNYFKLRADNLLKKEYAKTKLQKHNHGGLVSLEKANEIPSFDNIDEYIKVQELMDGDATGILRLKSEGYNQEEIAKSMGLTQSYVSKLLRKMKEEFDA